MTDFSNTSQRMSLDAVIAMLDRGQLGPKSQLPHHAANLRQTRERVAAAERRERNASDPRTRGLSDVIAEETRRR